MQKWKVEYRRSARKPTCRRGHSVRGTASFPTIRGLWESNTEYSDTSVEHVVQDFFHNVATLESDCGGDESDLRRNLSGLSVRSGAVVPPSDFNSSHDLPTSGAVCRKVFSRQKKKKRRSKRKWRATAKALGEHHDMFSRRKCGSPIARPRRGIEETSNVAAVQSVVEGRAGSAFTSSEDESLARLFASGVQSKVISVARMGGEEVCSSVCVTESELSDTPWEESCDADDELSCFETPKLHACLSAMGRCDGDVEDESETAASDQDKQWSHSHAGLSTGSFRRPLALRRAVQTSARHLPVSSQTMPSTANSLAQINRLLAQFVSGERSSSRYLRLPPMNRPARRIVWRLATLYNLQCHTERTGRLQCLLLAKTAASRLPEAGVLEQLCQRASMAHPIPTVPLVRHSLGRPLESEELVEPSDVSDVVNRPGQASVSC